MPCFPSVPYLGFGYPFYGFESQRPVKASFSSRRSWVSPFRAFLPAGNRKTLSDPSLRSCVSLENLSAFYRRFNGFIPPAEPSSFLLPEGLVRVGLVCSLGLCDLSGFSLSRFSKKKLLPFSFPFSFLRFKPLSESKSLKPQGLSNQPLGSLPISRAPACLAFLAV